MEGPKPKEGGSERRNTILAKLRRSMTGKHLDGLVALSPENFHYASGSPSYFLDKYRTAGLAIAVIPYSDTHDPAIIASNFEAPTLRESSWIDDVRTYPIWVYIEDSLPDGGQDHASLPDHSEASSGFGVEESFHQLSVLLEELGLSTGEWAIEMGYVQRTSWQLLHKHVPSARFTDAGQIWFEARRTKESWEVQNLKIAASVTEAAMAASVGIVKEGVPQSAIQKAFVLEGLKDDRIGGVRFAFVRVGEAFSPAPHPQYHRAKTGDLIGFDVGLECEGYASDLAKTYVLGKANERQQRVHEAMLGAFNQALGMIEPGTTFSDVYRVAIKHVQECGFPHFSRGHIGHSIGLGPGTEEPPFISPTEDSHIEPGMVLCLELPYYARGLGAIMVEDMIYVGSSNRELLSTPAEGLIEL